MTSKPRRLMPIAVRKPLTFLKPYLTVQFAELNAEPYIKEKGILWGAMSALIDTMQIWSRSASKNIERRMTMPKFYYTYGTDPRYPFHGGWTEIEAPDWAAANGLFRTFHPDRGTGLYNYADSYSEAEFLATEMAVNGNFDACCHERITVSREVFKQGEPISHCLPEGGCNADES